MASLTITILGAGISGLTCALALRQKGHNVILLEKSANDTEAGAAILLGPNCSGILIELGFKPENVGANLFTGWAQYNAKGNCEEGVKMRMDLTEVNKQWKNPWFCIHRQDLHDELKRLVLDPEGKGPVPVLKLGCKVVGIDVENGVVELSDGRMFKSDVIIGADGLHSFARTYIERNKKPYVWGKSAYRWLIPRAILLADPLTKDLIGEEGWFGEISEGDRRIVMYPCRDNTEMNFVGFVPNDEATDLGSGSSVSFP
jgi:salicylate hydroxylase